MIFPTSFSPLKSVVLNDSLSIHPLSRGVLEEDYGTSYLDAIRLEGYEKTDGVLKSWVIFHTFILNSRQTAIRYEQSHIVDRDFKLIDEKLTNRIDYAHILPWVYLHNDQNITSDKDASYTELYQKYISLPTEKKDIICNYLNDFSNASRARSVNRAISDPSYWQMMVYYSVIEKILGKQSFCGIRHSCEECGTKNINHNSIPQFDWIQNRLIEITKNNETAVAYMNVIWAVRQKIRHRTVHESLTPFATQSLPQSEDRVLFDLSHSVDNYMEDHHAVESLIHMLGDIARYLLLNDVYLLGIFPLPRPLGVITLRQPGVAIRGI